MSDRPDTRTTENPEHVLSIANDGGDGYIACSCGYGHVLGDDNPAGHIIEAEAAQGATPTLKEAEAYHEGRMDEWRRIRGNESEGAAPRAEGLDVPTIHGESDHALEALRHLFWIMERLDKQAGPPFSHDHMVKITSETWLDLVRPAIEIVRSRLSPQERRDND